MVANLLRAEHDALAVELDIVVEFEHRLGLSDSAVAEAKVILPCLMRCSMPSWRTSV